MERELWPRLYRALRAVAHDVCQKAVTYPPWVIVAVALWAALHDRPISWACQERHWAGTALRPARLPSGPTMSRRLRGLAVGCLLRALQDRLGGPLPAGLALIIDGKPLPVGGASKDQEARVGHGAGRLAKGYKLYAVWGRRAIPEAWRVEALNVDETAVAPELIRRLSGGGYLVGDVRYDSNALYDVAAAAGFQLVAPGSRKATGRGHCYQSPHRRHGRELLSRPFGRELLASRRTIERAFGSATSFGGGLAPLPSWVRGRDRVELWVWAKLLINAARIVEKQRLAA